MHRHTLPLRLRGRSFLSASVIAATVQIIPAVQNPHWKPPAARKFSCTGCRSSGVPSPWIVVTDFPAIRWAG